MHRRPKKLIVSNGSLGSMIVASCMFVLSGSCLFDTKTNLCESFGLRCAPGQECAAEQAICINIGGCGDGVVGREEACDDGNVQNGDACSSNCRTETLCGNGILDLGEECDAGVGEVDSQGCDGDCTFVTCGDGHMNAAAGEECDTGNENLDTSTCNGRTCRNSVCGDNVYNRVAGEMCDTGGDTQACNGNGNQDSVGRVAQHCQIPKCGDGYVNKNFAPSDLLPTLTEKCDDGNNFDCGTCTAGCVAFSRPDMGSIKTPAAGNGSINESETFVLNDGAMGVIFTYTYNANPTGSNFIILGMADDANLVAMKTQVAISNNGPLKIAASSNANVVNLTAEQFGSGKLTINIQGLNNRFDASVTAGVGTGPCGGAVGCKSDMDCISGMCENGMCK